MEGRLAITVCNDIDLIPGTYRELQYLTNGLADSLYEYGIETSTYKSKVMVIGNGKAGLHERKRNKWITTVKEWTCDGLVHYRPRQL